MKIEVEFEDLNPDFYGDVLSLMVGKVANYTEDWSSTGPLIVKYQITVTCFGEESDFGKKYGGWGADIDKDGINESECGRTPLEAVVKAIIKYEVTVAGSLHGTVPTDLLCQWLSYTTPIFEAVTQSGDEHDVRTLDTEDGPMWLATPKNGSIRALDAFSNITRVLHQLDGKHTMEGDLARRLGLGEGHGVPMTIVSVLTEERTGKEYATSVLFGYKMPGMKH